MLTEKDYCDYDTCVALKELGYNDVTQFFFNKDEVRTPRIPLYEAQKWLREKRNVIVLVGFDFCPITSKVVYNWVIVVNGNTARKYSYTYDYYETALDEGIKKAVKMLKEEK